MIDLKERLRQQLDLIRGISEQTLSVFETPEEWTHQVHPKANHALWFAGHVGIVDNFMLSRISPEKAAEPEGYREKFGMGSRPTSDPSDYPPIEEVLAFMRERRQVVLDVLDALGDDELTMPTPEGTPEFITDVASVFQTAVWHEALHLGQVTVARRALGFAPLVDAPPT